MDLRGRKLKKKKDSKNPIKSKTPHQAGLLKKPQVFANPEIESSFWRMLTKENLM
jgi:hypothetical protein